MDRCEPCLYPSIGTLTIRRAAAMPHIRADKSTEARRGCGQSNPLPRFEAGEGGDRSTSAGRRVRVCTAPQLETTTVADPGVCRAGKAHGRRQRGATNRLRGRDYILDPCSSPRGRPCPMIIAPSDHGPLGFRRARNNLWSSRLRAQSPSWPRARADLDQTKSIVEMCRLAPALARQGNRTSSPSPPAGEERAGVRGAATRNAQCHWRRSCCQTPSPRPSPPFRGRGGEGASSPPRIDARSLCPREG
jgi:hypothetical protein